MSYNYQLPDGMTNADVNDQDLFYLLIEMDFLGISKMDAELFRKRMAVDALVRGIPKDQYDLFVDFAKEVHGMTTNIKSKTDAQFRKDMWMHVEDYAERKYLGCV